MGKAKKRKKRSAEDLAISRLPIKDVIETGLIEVMTANKLILQGMIYGFDRAGWKKEAAQTVSILEAAGERFEETLDG